MVGDIELKASWSEFVGRLKDRDPLETYPSEGNFTHKYGLDLRLLEYDKMNQADNIKDCIKLLDYVVEYVYKGKI